MRMTIGIADIIYVVGAIFLLLFAEWIGIPSSRAKMFGTLIFAFFLGCIVNWARSRFGPGKSIEFTTRPNDNKIG